MRELISLYVGQAGNSVASEFWELICKEHEIDPTGAYVGKNESVLPGINVYFTETKGLRYRPRSILVDLDRNAVDITRSSPYGQIFSPDSFLFGDGGTKNNWAKGHFSEGADLCNIALEAIRKQVEGCDCFHGFQMTHSIGGGTGGGLGSLLISHLREEYPGRLINSFSIIPSPKVSLNILEPYNAMLSMSHLIESTQETYCMDNEALYNVTTNKMNLTHVSFHELNHLISLVISGVTTGMRFPGPLNMDLRKLAVNMIPFPRLHFFVPGFAPVLRRESITCKKFTLEEITSDLFDHKNMFAACDSRKGKFLTVACIFRGKISTKEVDTKMSDIQNANSSHFVEWIPNNIKTAICNISPPGYHLSATFTGNGTSVQDLFKRVKEQYLLMYKKKAYLHWFKNEGLEELEFESAEVNVNDLLDEYQASEDAAFETTNYSDNPCPQRSATEPL